MRSFLSAFIMAALTLLAFATAGSAQAQGADWTGTWSSQHGDLRLIQEGSRVYGDYAERGYFEGRVSEDGTRLRGTFQYNSPRSSNGYIEFRRSGDSFTGGWNWARNGPVAATKGNWRGSLKSAAMPQLRFAVGRDEFWADFWSDAGAASREWSFAGVSDGADPGFANRDFGDDRTIYQTADENYGSTGGYETAGEEDARYDYGSAPGDGEEDRAFDYGPAPTGGEEDTTFDYGTAPTGGEEDISFDYGAAPAGGEQDNAFDYDYAAAPTGPWTGTFSTNHGDLRLIQIGNRVFGDYAARGYFEGCVRDGGQTLRGTFQYLSPRSRHGFIEFRLSDESFAGTWAWTTSGVPRSNSTINWRGTRKSADTPTLNYVSQDELHFADMWNTIGASQRAWVLGQQGADQCAASGL